VHVYSMVAQLPVLALSNSLLHDLLEAIAVKVVDYTVQATRCKL
jgi:hypothetical protein